MKKINKSKIKIFAAKSSDALGIIKVQKITWLDTYPNKKYGITKKIIESRFVNMKERAAKWRKNNIGSKIWRCWVAKNGEGVVAFCGAGKLKERNQIGAIYILPKYQNQGIGKALMDKAFEWLGERKNIYLGVAPFNKKAIKFYNKFGFKFVSNGGKPKIHQIGSAKFPEVEMVKIFNK